ncbi:MAG: disulfide isomerase DsbC N-terminal domain-containing protein [Methylococcaceae bacterium]|nr:disulfide isomerase DsbC N-terminal domain-containing protein [Methylococcaceae bacterium]
MRKSLTTLTLGALFAFSPLLMAEESSTKAIEESLKQAAPGLTPSAIKPSKIPGIYEVAAGSKVFYMTEDGKYLIEGKLAEVKNNKRPTPIAGVYEFKLGSKLYYTTADGDYFIEGSLIDVKDHKDLTEAHLGEGRIAELDKIGLSNMLVFKPKKPKHHIYVFTDIDCGYCRKLHSEIDQYQGEGIEVRYLFFPRAGVGSESYNKAVAVWCSKDRNGALTKAKKGETLELKQCTNPVEAHMKLGEEFGASGTPMIVTQKGTILPGYVPADKLAKILQQESPI